MKAHVPAVAVGGALLAMGINHLIDVSGCWLGEPEVKRLTHAERPHSGGGPKGTVGAAIYVVRKK